jgi:two-component system, LytTR family, sensor kinase
MINREYLTMPLLAGVGVLGGLLRDLAPDPEDIWRFSPFFDLNIWRFFKRAASTGAPLSTCSSSW